MKKILLPLLIAALLLLASVAPAYSLDALQGWTVTGSISTSTDAAYGSYSAAGVGTIQQTVYFPGGNGLAFAVYCKGNPVITFSHPDWTETQDCGSSAIWTSIGFHQPYTLSAGNIVITAQLQEGDYVDQFCLFQDSCPPSLLTNYGFETGAPTPTPTCTPRGKSGKCK